MVPGSTPNARNHLALRGGPQPDQLHRRQPPARLVPGVPREGGQPVHRDQPALLTSEKADTGGNLGRPGRQQREPEEHTSPHPPHPPGLISCNNFLTYRANGT